jgi:uncharacterized membrane protein YfcA
VDPSPLRDVLTFAAGIGTGVMSGTFGVGGAVVSTPAIRLLGASAAVAVGTTLPSIFPGAVSGTIQYEPQRLVDWALVAVTVPAGMVAAVLGAEVAHVLPGAGHPLMILTALLLFSSAVQLIRDRPDRLGAPRRPEPRGSQRVATISGIGATSGLLSGLLGIGGGVIMVPAFRALLHVPIKRAIATSLVCVGCFAIPGTITHALNRDIDWRFAIWLAAGVIPGARIGARVAIQAADHRLRVAYGSFLALVSVIYAAGELYALF